MNALNQAIGATVLAAATYFGILRIAEAKCDEAVGSIGVALDEKQGDDLDAFHRLQAQLAALGQSSFASRLEELRKTKALWVAPELGSDRWAAYVQALGLVKRIYIRRIALRDPRLHLYPHGAADIPAEYQLDFAWLSLGGAMRHELAHYDGALDEAGAYQQELNWYNGIRGSAQITRLEGDRRAAWDFALDSAILSAREAARLAGATLSQ
ncbi:MAG: hypothetical protein ABI672_02100 [Vicinamibacteria bacterium]